MRGSGERGPETPVRNVPNPRRGDSVAKTIPPVDLAVFLLESKQAPTHVAALPHGAAVPRSPRAAHAGGIRRVAAGGGEAQAYICLNRWLKLRLTSSLSGR